MYSLLWRNAFFTHDNKEVEMKRNEFLQVGCRCGIGAVAALLVPAAFEANSPAYAGNQQQQQPDVSTKVHAWVVGFLAAVDTQLDPAARSKLLQECGRAEFRGLGIPPQPVVTLEQLAEEFRARGGGADLRFSGNELEWFSDRCGCPLVGPTPERLSDTWCECARGAMMEFMNVRLGRPVRVELREAIKRGGQRCHWVITA